MNATTQSVTAALRAAGFSASIRNRRQLRSGYAVRKMGRQVAILWNDYTGRGDTAAQFHRMRAVLAAAGFRETYTNLRGACVRVVLPPPRSYVRTCGRQTPAQNGMM